MQVTIYVKRRWYIGLPFTAEDTSRTGLTAGSPARSSSMWSNHSHLLVPLPLFELLSVMTL